MKILHIDTGGEMRGGQYQVELLADLLRRAGHTQIVLGRKDSPLAARLLEQGFEFHPAEIKSIWKHSQLCELVHAHDARAHTLAAMASRRRFVVSRRVAFPVQRSVASQWKYQRATRYLAVSQFVARQLEAVGIRREKIDIVYDAAAEVDFVNQWDASAPAIAIKSADPGKLNGLIASAAQEAQLPLVFSDDLVRDFRAASMFVYCTRSEGLGSAALLAMRAGVPVIASRIEGLAEVLEDKVSGLYVENNPVSVADAMKQMAAHPALARKLIEEGQIRVRQLFSEERLIEQTVLSYRRALAS